MTSARLSTAARPIASFTTCRRFLSTTPRAMAEGDTGSGRSGGERQGDAFTKREKANEDSYVKMHEREKLNAIREKLRQANKNTTDPDSPIKKDDKK